MVMSTGYSTAQMSAAVAQMAQPHVMRVRAELYDFNHTFLRDLGDLRVDEGAVTVTGNETITRTLTLSIIDRTDMLGLSAAASTPKFLIQVWRGIYVKSLSEWIDIPVGCFYVTRPRREGDILTIEGQDKGALGSFKASALTIKKGTNVASAIRTVMGSRAGETRFKLPATGVNLSRDFVLTDDTTPLELARKMAKEAKWQLFYDGLGYLTGRTWPSGVAFTFRTGMGGSLTSKVALGYWDGDIVNRVEVLGPIVNYKKISAYAMLPDSHPLSEAALGRNGTRLAGRRTEVFESKTLKTAAAAKSWCEERLASLAIQQQTAAFDSIPIWHLQEGDLIEVADDIDGVYAKARWTEASIPLTCEGEQSNGYARRPTLSFTARRGATWLVDKKKKKAYLKAQARKKAAAKKKKKK